jgi:hypothetical protein
MSTDAFTAQIIEYVRRMPDEAILDLVKNRLTGMKGLVSPLAPVAKARPGRKPGRKPGPKPAAAAPAAKATVAKAAPAAKRGPKPKKAKAAKATKRAGRGGRGGAGRQDTLNLVERVVKAGSGLAASDVAKAASIPQSRASTALKELKLAKRIFQGGDRRFARYAGDAKTAEQASLHARKNAAGPQGRGKKK